MSKGMAAKAWRKAQSATVKPYRKHKKKQGGLKGKYNNSQKQRQKGLCYYCNKPDHLGGNCPDKKAGKPPHPIALSAKLRCGPVVLKQPAGGSKKHGMEERSLQKKTNCNGCSLKSDVVKRIMAKSIMFVKRGRPLRNIMVSTHRNGNYFVVAGQE